MFPLSRRLKDDMTISTRQLFVMLVSLAVCAAMTAPQGAGAQDRDNLAGQLLVAGGNMGDSRFSETVVFMVRHDAAQGAMGLVINKPGLSTTFAALFERLRLDAPGDESLGEITVHYGGPVQPGQGFMLHSPDVLVEGSLAVTDSVAMTTRSEMLRRIAQGDGPARSLFIFGHAGWAPGQLEWEIQQGAWLVIPAEDTLVFAEDPERTWERAVARRGLDL